MRNKLRILVILVISLATVCCIIFSGCSTIVSQNQQKDPFEAIKEVYGTQEFTVSFSSENLSEPIDDIKYSAYNMPTLPNPKRVGYVFDGWYFDKEYTRPCSDNSLYLYMSDVVLYAKWIKEEMVNNGVYDISINLYAVEGSLLSRDLAEKYNSSPQDFISSVDIDEIKIEKSESGLQLKLPYDIHTTQTFDGSAETYTITVNSSMGSSVYIKNRVAPLSETNRTIYIDIENFNLEDTLFLNVISYKWDADTEEGENIDETRISYILAIDIIEFSGFESAFADTDIKLEDGYYSVKTYFEASSDVGTEMLEGFNSVYSYILAENGQYTLIKPFTPYTGYVGDGLDLEYYYEPMTAFIMPGYYYKSDVSSDTAKVENYGELSVEFHADSGRYYYIFDLGDSVQKSISFFCTVSGPMEQMFHSGTMAVDLLIDYEHMIKVEDTGYTPLSGTSFKYSDEFSIAGSDVDISFDTMKQTGFSLDYINFFYRQNGDEKTMFSHKLTVSSSNSITSIDGLTDVITAFKRNFRIYGYEPESGGELYKNQLASNQNGSLWENRSVKPGMLVSVGDVIDLTEVYTERVDFNGWNKNVKVEVYPLVEGKIDFKTQYQIDSYSLIFESDIAVKFTDESGSISIVEMCSFEYPDIYFEDGLDYDYQVSEERDCELHYYASGDYHYNDLISYPDISYEWLDIKGKFLDYYFAASENELYVNPVYSASFSVSSDGTYKTLDIGYDNDHSLFVMNDDHVAIVYEMLNTYNEKYYVIIHYIASGADNYSIEKNGTEICSGKSTFSNGQRDAIIEESLCTEIISINDLDTVFNNEYILYIDGEINRLELKSAKIYTREFTRVYEGSIKESITSLINEGNYLYVELRYVAGDDEYIEKYISGISFDGITKFTPLPQQTVFSGTEYVVSVPRIIDFNGNILGEGTLVVGNANGYGKDSFTDVANTGYHVITFNRSGDFRIRYYIHFGYDANGTRVFAGQLDTVLYFEQSFQVISGTASTVTITYTDTEEHPLLEQYGNSSYTVEYSVTDSIYLLNSSYFQNQSGANLLAWAVHSDYTYRDVNVLLYTENAIRNFISTFNAQHVILYPVWDEKITVELSLMTVNDGNTEIIAQNVRSHTFAIAKGAGNYQVDASSYFKNIAEQNTPEGYVLAGFKGGFLGEDIVPVDELQNLYFLYDASYYAGIEEPFSIYAIYLHQFKVSYQLNADYTNSYFANEYVLDGYFVSEKNVLIINENYTFAGWSIKNEDGSYTADDIIETLSKFSITSDTVFVALFYDEYGKLVW